MGTDVDTLITALRFSAVMMDGFDSTLTRFSLAMALSGGEELVGREGEDVEAHRHRAARGGISDEEGREGSTPEGEELTSKRPERTAHSMPSLVSSVSVTSAASTSISTWRGILSSLRVVSSISFQRRG